MRVTKRIKNGVQDIRERKEERKEGGREGGGEEERKSEENLANKS